MDVIIVMPKRLRNGLVIHHVKAGIAAIALIAGNICLVFDVSHIALLKKSIHWKIKDIGMFPGGGCGNSPMALSLHFIHIVLTNK